MTADEKVKRSLRFEEFARLNGLAPGTHRFLELQRLYQEVQSIRELIERSDGFVPVGPSSTGLFFDRFEQLGVTLPGKDEALKALHSLTELTHSYVERARQREADLMKRIDELLDG